jgi:rhamnulokinase
VSGPTGDGGRRQTSAGPSLIAIDLGAESCRVSVLQWSGDQPHITMVRRFANAPQDHGAEGLHWNLDHICVELEAGLRECAELAPEGIAGIGVTGWAVDYVRLNGSGEPIGPPFCYRDPRTRTALEEVHAILPAEKLYALTGVQIQPLNTIYQLFADKRGGANNSARWLNLPEYILHWLGAPRIAEYTNATHTGLIDPERRQWSGAIFEALGLDGAAAPEIVFPGTALGPLRKDLACLPAFAKTQLIAPACHDTASAVAAISPRGPGEWAYISSGTWSLVGTRLEKCLRTPEACARGFTNLGAADGTILFHRGIAGLWLLQQCMNTFSSNYAWSLPQLIAAARILPEPNEALDLDDPAFGPPGDMPAHINEQLRRRDLPVLPDGCEAAPHYANLIFHSLARRYAELLRDVENLTKVRPKRICVAGGGSRNEYLNELTANATGIAVERCAVESSTLGNFAVQWARLEQDRDGVTHEAIAEKATVLAAVEINQELQKGA